MAQTVKNLFAMQETQFQSLGQKDPYGEGNGNLLQYSCLENPMDRRAWWATVHGIAKSQTRLRNLKKKTQRVYLWQIRVDVWQNQYNIVK